MADGGNARSAKAIYHLFIKAVIESLNPDYFTWIVPSRWMIGGKGLDSFRNDMMNDRHLQVIVDDMSCNKIFPTVDIAGGVHYALWNKEHNDKCNFNGVDRFLDEEDIIIRENESRSILNKVKATSVKFVGMTASPRKPYGLEGDAVITQSGIPCWFKQSIGKVFVDPLTVKNVRNDIHLWKVLAPRAPIAGQTDFTKPIAFFNDNNLFIASPGEICTETYIVINSFDSESDAINFISYMKTKFFRFMLRMRVVSQDITRENYNWVPDVLDYSTKWTDKELYKKFGLTRQEQDYIKSKIKAI